MYRLQHALTAVLLLAAMFVASACDSGVPPDELSNTADPTVITFAGSETNVSERDTTVTISVQVENPGDSEVSAELLFAAGASSASIADFNIDDATAVNEDETAFVLRTVTFPAGAEDGATQSFTYTLTDNVEEPEAEVGIFALQNVSGANVGSGTFRVNIAAEGTVRLLEEDFSDDSLDPFGTYSVATMSSASEWETASPPIDLSPVAQANAFGSAQAANDWLITPALNLEGFDAATLTFISIKGFDDGGDEPVGLFVKVSTDYSGSGNPEDATWTDITSSATLSSGGNEETPSGDVDLSDFIGNPEVYVAFQYISSGTGPGSSERWQVDNIAVDADE
jgi:hypothetical protein